MEGLAIGSITRAGASCLLPVAALLATSAPASAAPKRIAGELSKPGYTVIALASDGEARSVRTRGRRFALRPPSSSVTLHLRAPNGRYAGPVVVRSERNGRRAIVGVRDGARLGRVRIRRGYATVSRRLASRSIDQRRWARARRGVPTGAGRFGRVRSTRTGRGAPGDRDLDGIPDPLDIDDDGDLILDNLDRPDATRAAASQLEAPELGISTFFPLPLSSTSNVHAVGPDLAWIDLNFSQMARLGIEILPGDQAELDCGGSPDPSDPGGWTGGLGYCVRGGTGGHFLVPDPTPDDPFDWPPFPESQDPDGDGFGTLQPGSGGGMFLIVGTTTDRVRSGDLLIERVTTGGSETAYPATLQYVFNTIPALVSYQDETMSSPQPISYPVQFPSPGTRSEDGFPVSDGPEDADDDVEVTFTFWRPQRQRIAGEPGDGEWMDIGGLTYTMRGFFAGGQFCGPQTAYSTQDPNLIPTPPETLGTDQKGVPGGGFTDSAADRPADRANTLTFTVNVSECLRAQGVTFNPGDSFPFSLTAISAASNFSQDQAEQQFHIERR